MDIYYTSNRHEDATMPQQEHRQYIIQSYTLILSESYTDYFYKKGILNDNISNN